MGLLLPHGGHRRGHRTPDLTHVPLRRASPQGVLTHVTTKIAIWLGVLLIGAALFDVLARDSTALIALGRRLIEVIDWMRFWG